MKIKIYISTNYIFILFYFNIFTNFAKDNLAGEISQNHCSNNETPNYIVEQRSDKCEKHENVKKRGIKKK